MLIWYSYSNIHSIEEELYQIMGPKPIDPNIVISLLNDNNIATLDELKQALKTHSTMTVFRKLKALDYLSSYSHRGTARAILRTPELSALKTLFQRIICVSSITIIQKVKENQNPSRDYPAFIL
jgi:uncharacterized membrane-anchored protein YhcB (DUF1043 family)